MKGPVHVQTEVAALRSRLQSRLAGYGAKTEVSVPQLEIIRVRDAAYSRLFFFHGANATDHSSIQLVVKVYKGIEQLEFARQQYDTLNLLWSGFCERPYLKVPHPLDFFADLPAIVMEEIKGQSVQDLIRWSSWRHWTRYEAWRACHRCGEWLHHFHDVTRVADGRLDAVGKQENLKLGLDQLVKYGFAIEMAKSLEAKGRCLVGILSEQCDQRALVHGDFSVDNVLLDGEITTALDIEGRYQNLIYHDIASFLNSIALMSLGLPMPVSFRRKCSDSFLRGYGEAGNRNFRALWFLRVVGLVSVALEVFGRYQRQPFVQLWLRNRFARLFNGLASEAPV